MKISIQALELILSPEELKQKIPKEKLEQLKGKGVLQAYTLAQEGLSHPKILGQGTETLRWPKSVIHQIAEKIKQGTKFFIGHGENNSHDNRESVGEVLTSFVKEIKGKISNVIIGYFPEKEKVNEMDTCSMEADVFTDNDNIVGDVNDVSGIALGSSDKDNPAFPGALRLSMVQCFGKEDDKDENKPKEKQMTFEDIKKGIRDLNIRPWQIFTLDDMKEDRNYGKLFSENSTLKSDNERLTNENKEIKDKSKEAIRTADVTSSKGRLDKIMEEGYTDKQKKFIGGRFDPEAFEDLSDDKLKEYVENGKKEFADTAKLFGVDVMDSNGTGEKKKESSGDTEELTPEEEALKIMSGVK